MTETPINFNRAKISCRAPKFSTEVKTFIISKMGVLEWWEWLYLFGH